MSRNRRIIAAVVVAGALLVPVAAIANPGDEHRAVKFTPAQAADHVAVFAGHGIKAADLTVDDPIDGIINRVYRVHGPTVAANVDAHSGEVLSLLFTTDSLSASSAARKVDSAAALATAKAFASVRSVATSGLDETVQFADHGERSEFVVEWIHRVNGVIVPDYRLVGVDASTGEVWRFLNVSRPYADPGKPAVQQAAAEAAARTILTDATGVKADSAELRVTFTQAGEQRLVWQVSLSGIADGTTADVTSHWFVEVDAMSGAATLLATG